MRAANFRRRPVRCRWCALTGTTTRCRCVGRIIRSWPKVTVTESSCMQRAAKWPGIHGSGKTSRSALSRCIIWRCWRPNRGHWITPDRWQAGRDGEGTREYIKVLRLLEKHPLPKLRAAVEQALQVGAITRDAVAQFLYPQEDWRATLFSLDGHPHLRQVRVAAPNLASYRELVGGVA